MNAVKELGKRLAARLDEDDWGYIEPFLNECETELESLRQQLAECQATNWKLREALDAVQQVANSSEGIAGWHLNGDIASWDSILPEVDEALALPNDATALSELIAERTASLTAELQSTRLQMITDFGQYQEAHEKVKELTAQRDAAMRDAERWRTVELLMFLGNVELNQDEDGGYKILLFPAENIVDQGWEGNSPEQVIDAAIANCKEQ